MVDLKGLLLRTIGENETVSITEDQVIRLSSNPLFSAKQSLANETDLSIFSIDLQTDSKNLPLKIGGEINIDYGQVSLEVIGFESEETYGRRLD